MPVKILVNWVLILLVVWLGVAVFVAKYFDGTRISQRKSEVLKSIMHRNKRRLAKANLQFNEYKDYLARSGIKLNDRTGWNDPVRLIASANADAYEKNSPLPQGGDHRMERVRQMFLARDFSRTIELSEDFCERYPDHPLVPEARLLKVESFFYLDLVEASLKEIDFLVTHYPETLYAAFSMLRLAKVMEKRERPEEAAEVYQAIMESYPKSEAARLAKAGYRDLDLW